MELLFAVIFSYFILTEVLNINQITGAAFMLSGFIISEFSFGIKKGVLKWKRHLE
jgi:drug/metabolite transporter (DMT)-like permease